MDKCERCKHAICDYAEGYSSKECGMSGASGYTIIEGCEKECDAFFDDSIECEEYEEYMGEYV